MAVGVYSWQLTDRERRQAILAALAAASTSLGPLGPLMVWGFEYVYDRRDRIFNQLGVPLRAYGYDRSSVELNTLAESGTGRLATLSIDTSAADSRLRLGDPVSVVLSEHSAGQLRGGLVVPTRVGERVSLSLPRGSYSLAALGGPRKALFTSRDPYTALGGNNLVLDGQRQLYLPLSARTRTAPVASLRLPDRLNSTVTRLLLNPPAPRQTCTICGTELTADGVCLNATRCSWCDESFESYLDCREHERNVHWTAWDFVQEFFGNR